MPNRVTDTAKAIGAQNWIDEHQTAHLLACSLSKLRQDRHKCRGIPYTKLGRSVRYSLLDIQSYMTKNRVNPIQ